MILHCSAEHGWRLLDPDGFRAFKVVLAGLAPADAPPLDGLAFATRDGEAPHAWVRPDLPERLAGTDADEEWRTRFAAMAAFAASKGWVRPDGAIPGPCRADGVTDATGRPAPARSGRRGRL